MPKHVFFSFHYGSDAVRASQVRNFGAIDGNAPASDNDWETVKRGGDPAIQRWIDNQLYGRTCTVVLIGAGTAGRKWINYEIEQSWSRKMGLLGVYVHRLKSFDGQQSAKGANPFETFTLTGSGAKLSSIVRAYEPPYFESKDVYKYIGENLSGWIDEAIRIRNS